MQRYTYYPHCPRGSAFQFSSDVDMHPEGSQAPLPKLAPNRKAQSAAQQNTAVQSMTSQLPRVTLALHLNEVDSLKRKRVVLFRTSLRNRSTPLGCGPEAGEKADCRIQRMVAIVLAVPLVDAPCDKPDRHCSKVDHD
jgi:hypothetical protein